MCNGELPTLGAAGGSALEDAHNTMTSPQEQPGITVMDWKLFHVQQYAVCWFLVAAVFTLFPVVCNLPADFLLGQYFCIGLFTLQLNLPLRSLTPTRGLFSCSYLVMFFVFGLIWLFDICAKFVLVISG